jgi:hypothetical protein
MGWPDIHWLVRDKGGWTAGSRLDLSMPLEPMAAPSGWRCPYRHPTVMGSIGDVVLHTTL